MNITRRSATDSDSYRSSSSCEALLKHGVNDPAFAEQLAEGFQSNRRKRHVVYGDVRPVLDALRQSHKLGLLTNGAPDLQREKIDGAGIGEYFDAIVTSGEIGVGKPDRRAFEIMTSRLGVSLDAAFERLSVFPSFTSRTAEAPANAERVICVRLSPGKSDS